MNKHDLNALRISNSQHLYPKNLICRFLDSKGRVYFRGTKNENFSEGKKTSCLSVSKLWDERSEKGWMKEIEDSFSELCKKIDNNLPLSQDDYQLVTEFYLLWYCRSYAELHPKDRHKAIPDSLLDEFKKGKVNVGLMMAAYVASTKSIPLITAPPSFDFETGHICAIKVPSRNKQGGNQYLHSSRILMTPPINNIHEQLLSSNVPWKDKVRNRSTLENINQREGVHFFDTQGYMSPQITNGQWIENSHHEWAKRFHNLQWGVLRAVCGEFVVPRGLNDAWLIPISPTIALLANYKGNHEINCGDILEFNKHLTKNSELWMCHKPENTMRFSEACPNQT